MKNIAYFLIMIMWSAGQPVWCTDLNGDEQVVCITNRLKQNIDKYAEQGGDMILYNDTKELKVELLPFFKTVQDLFDRRSIKCPISTLCSFPMYTRDLLERQFGTCPIFSLLPNWSCTISPLYGKLSIWNLRKRQLWHCQRILLIECATWLLQTADIINDGKANLDKPIIALQLFKDLPKAIVRLKHITSKKDVLMALLHTLPCVASIGKYMLSEQFLPKAMSRYSLYGIYVSQSMAFMKAIFDYRTESLALEECDKQFRTARKDLKSIVQLLEHKTHSSKKMHISRFKKNFSYFLNMLCFMLFATFMEKKSFSSSIPDSLLAL